jgi:hypothetical protein
MSDEEVFPIVEADPQPSDVFGCKDDLLKCINESAKLTARNKFDKTICKLLERRIKKLQRRIVHSSELNDKETKKLLTYSDDLSRASLANNPRATPKIVFLKKVMANGNERFKAEKAKTKKIMLSYDSDKEMKEPAVFQGLLGPGDDKYKMEEEDGGDDAAKGKKAASKKKPVKKPEDVVVTPTKEDDDEEESSTT